MFLIAMMVVTLRSVTRRGGACSAGLWSSTPRVLFGKENQAQYTASSVAYFSPLIDRETALLLLLGVFGLGVFFVLFLFC